MTLTTATLIICVFIFVGAVGAERAIKRFIEKRLDQQEKALGEIKTELKNLREVLEDVKHSFDNEQAEETP